MDLGKISLDEPDSPPEPADNGRCDAGISLSHVVSAGGEGVSGATLDSVTAPGIPSPAVPTKRGVPAEERLTGARLVEVNGAQGKRSFPVPPTGVTIGRSPYTAEIVLANRRVSSRHAWVGFVNGAPMLRDLNSTNGTYLNGDLNSPVSEAILHSGDTIFFSNYQGERLQFVIEFATTEGKVPDR